jgi:C-terminal processing protease CtpA/Prc
MNCFTRILHGALGALALAPLGALAQSAPAPQQLTEPQYLRDFDQLWTTLRDGYAYFDAANTDWDRVRAIYRHQASQAKSRTDFIGVLERVLGELHDPHTHLNVNTQHSPRLVPTGLDVWAEWRNGQAIVTQVRTGFSAEQAGLRPGMRIISVNGVSVEDAIRTRFDEASRSPDDEGRGWALRSALAGTREVKRIVEIRVSGSGETATNRKLELDLPSHQTVDCPAARPRVEARIAEGGYGIIRVNDLGSKETVAEFDRALEIVRTTRGLVLDLRATQSGGNTSVAEPILGRFIDKRMAYQRGQPRNGKPWSREVEPRGPWRYDGPLVVLVGRWTASMGEGMAMGLSGMKRATVVGTPMAGLRGAVFTERLKHSGIAFNYAAEKLFHVNGSPREAFVPDIWVENRASDDAGMLAEALGALARNKDGK